MWTIFVAWPLAGLTWVLFLGEQFVQDCAACCRAGARHEQRRRLTPAIAALLLFGGFFLLLVLRVPVAFALGLACLPMLVIEPRLSPLVALQRDLQGLQLVHPARGAVLPAHRAPDEQSAASPTGWCTCREPWWATFPGALAQVNVLLSVFFAGISGSSTADAASQSKIFIEAQTKEGYDLSFSIAITAVSAILAVIIPPSILMIVWGGMLTVSIGALFLAGIIPGLLLARRADGDRARLRQAAQLPGLPAGDPSRIREGRAASRSRR